MGERGPKGKPTEQALRDGTRKSRIPERPLRTGPAGGVELTPPENFNAWQQRAWDELTKLLNELDVLDAADSPTVEAAAAMLGRMREARHMLNREPDMGVVESQRGGLRSSPYWVMEREAGLQVAKLLSELGLSPSARAKLANAGAKSKKPEEQLDDVLGAPGRLRAVEGGAA